MSTTDGHELERQVQRRRTFAIISHPDAGKTTLTEKFLLYGGAIQKAGSVKGRQGRDHATSDWMEIEKKRGISITSSALQFEYEGYCVNLLDTPGHQDFSEDTYRTLVAADCALMLIDGAKGVEPQTIKLFKVCRDRGLPIITVVNKMDRPAKEPLDLIEEVEEVLGISMVPLTWPIGSGPEFKGVYAVDRHEVHLFERTDHNAKRAGVVTVDGLEDPKLAEILGADRVSELSDDVALVQEAMPSYDHEKFLSGQLSPMFFASALTNFGVENVLDRYIEIGPKPAPLSTVDGDIAPTTEWFSGFVYKVAANMDKQHRDRIAFLRVTSGHFERGMSAHHVRLGREVRPLPPAPVLRSRAGRHRRRLARRCDRPDQPRTVPRRRCDHLRAEGRRAQLSALPARDLRTSSARRSVHGQGIRQGPATARRGRCRPSLLAAARSPGTDSRCRR